MAPNLYIYGSENCERCKELKRLLDERLHYGYEFYDVEKDEEARRRFMEICRITGARNYPLVGVFQWNELVAVYQGDMAIVGVAKLDELRPNPKVVPVVTDNSRAFFFRNSDAVERLRALFLP
ncbi:glutaredoxin family protein [Pyrococcus yayanosii]|uniref:Glutaredoxin domain-containing protein n=1 Tax=Pyrococcus yayanosii (strain CH1 / JCM 16557) TaxID=529709 RepID=F8AEJ8_PYRYC|nr:glutaredoxin domain-containing protein [Pyrococcus yayanosii]AEH24677.1 hypothetical protein PYCH_09940 [Pyrococcus yayanosii CH1]